MSIPDGSRDVVVAGSATVHGGDSRLEPLARSLTRVVLDRGRPLVLGVGGESPISDRLAADGFTTLAVAPILTTRGHQVSDPSTSLRDHGEDAAVTATP